ncbi:MAG TPA: chemotaxis protein CheW [Opitutaceae bacterium]|nr:chemotaxis protein CheW [Opitutaceae bacterium]
MTPTRTTLSAQARALRDAFDGAFAAPLPEPPPPAVALLVVRAGEELVAIRRTEMTGFARCENLVPTPGCSPAFLGLAGLRDGVHPVWDLANLLGHPAASAPPRWLVLAEAQPGEPCALACADFERLVFVSAGAITGAAREEPGAVADGLAPWGSALVRIVNLPALLTSLRSQVGNRQ